MRSFVEADGTLTGGEGGEEGGCDPNIGVTGGVLNAAVVVLFFRMDGVISDRAEMINRSTSVQRPSYFLLVKLVTAPRKTIAIKLRRAVRTNVR